MKKLIVGVFILPVLTASFSGASAQRLFKDRKLYGPVPLRCISLSAGFIDGPEAKNLTDHLNQWAMERGGSNRFGEIGTSPYLKLQFERFMAPQIFFTSAVNFSYFNLEADGFYVTRSEPPLALDMNRNLSIYLFSLELGLKYYMAAQEVKKLIPYFGGGFSLAVPSVHLDTELYHEGERYSSEGESLSETSLEEGMHAEAGLIYFITNRQSASLEARYQMSQSKFDIHDANFDLRYRGITLALTITRHF
jgi:hypothetical protein